MKTYDDKLKLFTMWPNTSEVTTIANSTGIEIDTLNGITPVVRLADTTVTPGTVNFATVTFNQQGQATFASTGVPVTSINIAGSTGLVPSGGPITSTGTITLTLGTELQALSGLSGLGLVTRTAANTYAELTITANSANILVTNGNGVNGNPTIDLSSTPIVNSITIQDAPVASTDGVNKLYADALTSGIKFRDPCVAATTTNLNATYNNGSSGVGATLTNNGTLAAFSTDGYSPTVGSRVLIKNQTAQLQNGIYTLTTVGSGSIAWVLTRSTDYDVPSEAGSGTVTQVTNGIINTGYTFIETSIVTIIGTSAITFAIWGYGPSAFLEVVNNLSDLTNVATAVNNLGLTRAVLAASGTYAANTIPYFNSTTGLAVSDSSLIILNNSLGIGQSTPIYGLHLGTANSVAPQIYLASAPLPTAPVTANDGIFAVNTGAPSFVSGTAAYSGTLAVISSATAGNGTLVNGTLVINTTAVKTNSIIIVTPNSRTSAYAFAASQGSLRVGSIVAATSFTVSSTISTDTSGFSWMIFNL